MASYIIVHSRNCLFDEMIGYHRKLEEWIETEKSETLIALASVSAWCGSSDSELKILDKLARENKLSAALLSRYKELGGI